MATTYTPTVNLLIGLSIAEVVASALESHSVTLQTGTSLFPVLDHVLPNGTGAGKVNLVYWSQQVIASSGTVTLTLTSLTDPAGQSISFAKVKGIIVRVENAVTGNHVTLGNAGTHPIQLWFDATTDTEEIRDLSIHLNTVDGWTVSSGTHDQLLFTNTGAASITIDIVIFGE